MSRRMMLIDYKSSTWHLALPLEKDFQLLVLKKKTTAVIKHQYRVQKTKSNSMQSDLLGALQRLLVWSV